jgi:hypothetical protein
MRGGGLGRSGGVTRDGEPGFSLLELLLACGLVATLSAAVVPRTLAGLDEARGLAAARYVAGQVQWARWEAAAHGVSVGLRFEDGDDGVLRCASYMDGDADGLRTRDIDGGIDPLVRTAMRLSETFPGADFILDPDVPPVGQARPDGNPNPIRLGNTMILSVSPVGTATSGTVYVGAGRAQFAVRILGATGRARVLSFDPATREWRDR